MPEPFLCEDVLYTRTWAAFAPFHMSPLQPSVYTIGRPQHHNEHKGIVEAQFGNGKCGVAQGQSRDNEQPALVRKDAPAVDYQ